jgi:hypothetical protein
VPRRLALIGSVVWLAQHSNTGKGAQREGRRKGGGFPCAEQRRPVR